MHPPPPPPHPHPHLCVLLVFGETAPKQDVGLRGEVILCPLTPHMEIVLQDVQGSIVLSQKQQIAILTVRLGKRVLGLNHRHTLDIDCCSSSPVPGGVFCVQAGLDEPQSTAVRVHHRVKLQERIS